MTTYITSASRLFAIMLLLSFLTGQAYAEEGKYVRTVQNYTIPDVILVNQNGTKVRLRDQLKSNKPVIVEFIFATCTTICPVLSASFANLQQKLGKDSQKVHLISITIDPENDTPKVMKEYLRRYRAKPGWDFLTGSRADIDAVMNAFNAYVSNKMYHIPLTLMRAAGDDHWIRIYGLLNSTEFVNEYKKVGLK